MLQAWGVDTNGHTYQLFVWRGARLRSTLRAESIQTDPEYPKLVRHALRLANDLDIHPEVGPSSVRGNDSASFENDCGRDDERIRETETSPVSGAQLGGSPGDLSGGGLNRRRKSLEEVVDGIAVRRAMPERRDEDFGIGRDGDNQPVPSIPDS